MYVWAPNADIDDIEDMVWLMRSLKEMEDDQYRFRPQEACCCFEKAVRGDFLRADWVEKSNGRESDDLNSIKRGSLGAGLSLSMRTEDNPMAKSLTGGMRQSFSQRQSQRFRAMQESERQAQLKEESQNTMTRTVMEAWKGLKKYLYTNLFGTPKRATLTCVWLLFSVAVTALCTVRAVTMSTSFNGHKNPQTGAFAEDQKCTENRLREEFFGHSVYLLLLATYWLLLVFLMPLYLLWIHQLRPRYRECNRRLTPTDESDISSLISRGRGGAE